VEPVNTCLKGVEMLGVVKGDCVAILGQGPIGLIFTMLARRKGAGILASDTLPFRRELSQRFGADAFDPRESSPEAQSALAGSHADAGNPFQSAASATPFRTNSFEAAIKNATSGRGADAVIVATNAKGLVDQALRISRPGAKILLFAQTSVTDRIEISGADICVGERMLLGSYSADVNLQAESARLVFSGDLPLEQLVSDRVSLFNISAGIAIAQHPSGQSLKVVVHPQESN
jgi:L-iditol 2-dehydrogenase